MIKHISEDLIKRVFISIVVNNVVAAASSEITVDEDGMYRTKDDSITIYSDNPMYSLQQGILRTKEEIENDEDIKTLLEEKYKFKNDETSTRYKIAREERTGFPGVFKTLFNIKNSITILEFYNNDDHKKEKIIHIFLIPILNIFNVYFTSKFLENSCLNFRNTLKEVATNR